MTSYKPRTPSDVLELRGLLSERWSPGRAYYKAYAPMVVGAPIGQTANKACRHEQYMLDHAEVYYVTADMAELLQHFAPSMPDQALSMYDPPSPYGFIYFEKSLTGTDSHRYDVQVKVDALAWGLIRSGPLHKRPDTPMATITSYTYDNWSSFEEEVIEEYPELGGDPVADWAPLGRSDWPVGDTMDQPEWENMPPEQVQSMSEDRRWIATFWTLIEQFKLSDVSEIRAPRHLRRRLERDRRPVSTIKVVKLRRIHHPSIPTDEPGRVVWTHQWMVDGHWKGQWYPNQDLEGIPCGCTKRDGSICTKTWWHPPADRDSALHQGSRRQAPGHQGYGASVDAINLFIHDDTPEDDCDCHYAEREPHDVRDHKQDCSYAKGGAPMGEACGGCYGCLAQQAAYYGQPTMIR